MVHALEEIRRVLTPDGVLVDIRPLAGDMPVDVIDGNDVKFAGLVDNSAWIPDDEAADRALATVLEKGLYLKEEETHFIFSNYWDRLDQFQAYTEENWEETKMPEAVLHQAEEFVRQSQGAVKIRITLKMVFTRYRKQAFQN